MEFLYAPWRKNYTLSTAHTKNGTIDKDQCIFCIQFGQLQMDEKHFIIKRFTHTVVVLNLYPYNAGHLLLLPLEHHADFNCLAQQVRAQLMELITHSTHILRQTLGADGINVGCNLGRAAGAGIPSHLHMHVLPRWVGDTNFLPALAQTKQISFDLNDIYKKLKQQFDLIEL